MDNLEDLSKEELIKRVRLSADISLALDGLWFLAAENTNGYDKALEMDIDVWERYVPVAIKRIREHFDLPSTGLQGIKDIVKYDPLWIALDIEFLEDAPERLVFQVNRCPALEAMERIGRELLTCQPVEGAYLSKLAERMDPRIKVEPLKLPPRKSPDEICCQWLFSLE